MNTHTHKNRLAFPSIGKPSHLVAMEIALYTHLQVFERYFSYYSEGFPFSVTEPTHLLLICCAGRSRWCVPSGSLWRPAVVERCFPVGDRGREHYLRNKRTYMLSNAILAVFTLPFLTSTETLEGGT